MGLFDFIMRYEANGDNLIFAKKIYLLNKYYFTKE